MNRNSQHRGDRKIKALFTKSRKMLIMLLGMMLFISCQTNQEKQNQHVVISMPFQGISLTVEQLKQVEFINTQAQNMGQFFNYQELLDFELPPQRWNEYILATAQNILLFLYYLNPAALTQDSTQDVINTVNQKLKELENLTSTEENKSQDVASTSASASTDVQEDQKPPFLPIDMKFLWNPESQKIIQKQVETMVLNILNNRQRTEIQDNLRKRAITSDWFLYNKVFAYELMQLQKQKKLTLPKMIDSEKVIQEMSSEDREGLKIRYIVLDPKKYAAEEAYIREALQQVSFDQLSLDQKKEEFNKLIEKFSENQDANKGQLPFWIFQKASEHPMGFVQAEFISSLVSQNKAVGEIAWNIDSVGNNGVAKKYIVFLEDKKSFSAKEMTANLSKTEYQHIREYINFKVDEIAYKNNQETLAKGYDMILQSVPEVYQLYQQKIQTPSLELGVESSASKGESEGWFFEKENLKPIIDKILAKKNIILEEPGMLEITREDVQILYEQSPYAQSPEGKALFTKLGQSKVDLLNPDHMNTLGILIKSIYTSKLMKIWYQKTLEQGKVFDEDFYLMLALSDILDPNTTRLVREYFYFETKSRPQDMPIEKKEIDFIVEASQIPDDVFLKNKQAKTLEESRKRRDEYLSYQLREDKSRRQQKSVDGSFLDYAIGSGYLSYYLFPEPAPEKPEMTEEQMQQLSAASESRSKQDASSDEEKASEAASSPSQKG